MIDPAVSAGVHIILSVPVAHRAIKLWVGVGDMVGFHEGFLGDFPVAMDDFTHMGSEVTFF